jgi:hypothetical protein
VFRHAFRIGCDLYVCANVYLHVSLFDDVLLKYKLITVSSIKLTGQAHNCIVQVIEK